MQEVEMKDYNVSEKPQWCVGCGDFGILAGVRKAFVELGLSPHQVCVVSGIGCGSKIPHYIRSYGYEGLHGRALPLAHGVKLANSKVTVVTIGGDGDGLAEGGNHFMNSFRYNLDISYFMQDNQNYGLTTGQSSPTTHKGMKTKTEPSGQEFPETRPIPLALASGGTFVAATYSGNIKHMVNIFKEAINHKGFSFVDIYQPCTTWNYLNTYEFWSSRTYDLQEQNHDFTNFDQAIRKANEPYNTNWEKIPIGIFYKSNQPTLTDYLHIKENLLDSKLGLDISSDLSELV